ncbi:teichoic acid D-Ala incorporation-associated protein DltX [Metabacillus sp. RGM 3146]|uniref:teichoic acid D-Ala incorporation-associated protein DltX n=1 Tax=Metabacillus sp. RGM 3146 TaxID=3401092 RepID=UPI003B99C3E4
MYGRAIMKNLFTNRKTIWVFKLLFYFFILLGVYLLYGFKSGDSTFIYNEF